MGRCNQQEIDNVVDRCKKAVDHYGGDSDMLKEVRKWYSLLYRSPEHGALVVLEAELKKVGF